MGARKVGELAADGTNVRRGYWRAEQESAEIFRDSDRYQATEKLCCYAMNKTSLSGLSGLSSLSGSSGLSGLSG